MNEFTAEQEQGADQMEQWLAQGLAQGFAYARVKDPLNMAVQAVNRKPSTSGVENIAGMITSSTPIENATTLEPKDYIDDSAHYAVIMGVAFDAVKVKTIGQEAATDINNALTARVIGRLGMYAAAMSYGRSSGELTADIANGYADLATLVIKRDIPQISWTALKAVNLFATVREADTLLGKLDAAEVTSDAETHELSDANDSLWKASKILQTYGVKPVIAPATTGVFAKQWMFESPLEHPMLDQMKLIHGTAPAALIMGADVDFLTSKAAKQRFFGERSNTKFVRPDVERLFGDKANDSNSYSLVLLQDGHIATPTGERLDLLAEETNSEAAYQQLRAELLAIHFDLVTPVYVSDIVDDEAKDIVVHDPDARGKLRTLVLAREKVLRVLGSDIVSAIEDEIKTAHHKVMVEHDVVGHIRTIRPNFRASQDARDRCLEDLGIHLADYGETYVRNHTRGSVKEADPKGHVAVFKNGEVARANARSGHNGRVTRKGYTANTSNSRSRKKKKRR